MVNSLYQQDEDAEAVGFITESEVKTDEDESRSNTQNPNDENKLSEIEASPTEDEEEMCSESPGFVKGIIGVLYKG